MSDNPVWKAVKPFVNGGASGMVATCCIQPIDIVKVSTSESRRSSPGSALETGPRSDGMARRGGDPRV